MSQSRTSQSQSYLRDPEIHEQWESDYLNQDLDAFYDLAYDRIVERLRAPADSTILDAGVGYGFHALRLAKRGLRVVGVDFSPAALEQAARTIERAGLTSRVSLRQGDLLKLPFEDGAFSYLNCWGVLMHIPQIDQAVAELVRVVAPGGKLVITENNAGSLQVRLLEPAMRVAKRVLGRRVSERMNTARGIEEWYAQDSGGLLVRKNNIDHLSAQFAKNGARLIERFACQFTELYTSVRFDAAKRWIYRFNTAWFLGERDPRLALGNILIFQKAAAQNSPGPSPGSA